MIKKICNGCKQGPCVRVVREGMSRDPFPAECDLPRPETDWRDIPDLNVKLYDIQELMDRRKVIERLIDDRINDTFPR